METTILKVICEQLKFDLNQAIAQWRDFKYVMVDWDVPTSVLKGKNISPTAFILKKIVRQQAILKQSFHYIVDMAMVFLSTTL